MENIFLNISNWIKGLTLALGTPNILVSIIMSLVYFIGIVAFVLLNSNTRKNIQSLHHVLVVLLNWIQKNVFHVIFVL